MIQSWFGLAIGSVIKYSPCHVLWPRNMFAVRMEHRNFLKNSTIFCLDSFLLVLHKCSWVECYITVLSPPLTPMHVVWLFKFVFKRLQIKLLLNLHKFRVLCVFPIENVSFLFFSNGGGGGDTCQGRMKCYQKNIKATITTFLIVFSTRSRLLPHCPIAILLSFRGKRVIKNVL